MLGLEAGDEHTPWRKSTAPGRRQQTRAAGCRRKKRQPAEFRQDHCFEVGDRQLRLWAPLISIVLLPSCPKAQLCSGGGPVRLHLRFEARGIRVMPPVIEVVNGDKHHCDVGPIKKALCRPQEEPSGRYPLESGQEAFQQADVHRYCWRQCSTRQTHRMSSERTYPATRTRLSF